MSILYADTSQTRMAQKTRILFMQSQAFFGSDSGIHSLLMRYYNRSRIEVHAACNPIFDGEKSPALKALEKIPDLHLRRVNFGPTVTHESRWKVARETLRQGIPALVSLVQLGWYIRKNKIAIVHGTEKPRDAFYGLLLARATGAKCVIHVHVKCEDWISPMVRWAMRHADGLIGVSDFVAQSLIAKGYAPEKVHFALNSIEASQWNPATDGSAIRQEFGIDPGTPILAIISRLFRWKGHSELIKALAKVKEHNPNFKLLIVGEDDPRADPGHGSYMSELKTMVADLGLNDHVIFTGYRTDVPLIQAATDIFTMPSFEEPCAVAYLEAMAMCKPVIALDNGGTCELLQHGKDALLSPPQDIDALAANIETLLADPALRIQMGTYGRKRVEEYYTPQRLADECELIYQRILAGSPAHSPAAQQA